LGAGWKTPSVSGDWPPSPGSWQKAGRIEAPGSARSQKTRRLVSWQRWLPHFRSSGAVGVVYAGERYRQFRPPPSLRSATAVLTATRGKGVDRMPPQVADCPRNALQNEGRGVCRLTKDRQPRTCRGANWASQTARLLAGNATSTATATQARPGRWSFGGVVVYTIGGLLESRSPRRHASADRRWRWPRGCPNREPEVHTAVADGQIAQFRTEAKGPENERSTTRGELSHEKGGQ
jgi:hypothetical protein